MTEKARMAIRMVAEIAKASRRLEDTYKRVSKSRTFRELFANTFRMAIAGVRFELVMRKADKLEKMFDPAPLPKATVRR